MNRYAAFALLDTAGAAAAMPAAAALYAPEWGEPLTWCGTSPEGEIADVMSQPEAALLSRQLLALQEHQGYTIVTRQGLLDLKLLAQASNQWKEGRAIARQHVDLAFHVLRKTGQDLEAGNAARNLDLTPPACRNPACRQWPEGDREAGLEYCRQETMNIYDLAQAGEKAGSLRWTGPDGQQRAMTLRAGWLTVAQALKLPMPETGETGERSQYTQWLAEPPEEE